MLSNLGNPLDEGVGEYLRQLPTYSLAMGSRSATRFKLHFSSFSIGRVESYNEEGTYRRRYSNRLVVSCSLLLVAKHLVSDTF